MNKKTALCAALLLCLALGSCTPQKAEPTPSPTPVPTSAPTPAPTAAPVWTEEDAYAAFQAATETAGVVGWVPAGCAVADDGWGDLGAVVLYTDENRNNECNLAYLYQEGGIAVLGFAANASDEVRDFTPQSAPVYLGEGKVSVDARENATGKAYRFTVGNDRGESWDNFTVDSGPLE